MNMKIHMIFFISMLVGRKKERDKYNDEGSYLERKEVFIRKEMK